jgi:hypothetical protein
MLMSSQKVEKHRMVIASEAKQSRNQPDINEIAAAPCASQGRRGAFYESGNWITGENGIVGKPIALPHLVNPVYPV